MHVTSEGNSILSRPRDAESAQGSQNNYGLLPENKERIAATQINHICRKEELFSGVVEEGINEFI